MNKLVLAISLTLFAFIVNAQWIQTNGPVGGTVNCVAISGTNIFAGTKGGIFLSTNNGSSWTAVNNGLTSYTILSLLLVVLQFLPAPNLMAFFIQQIMVPTG
jgi:hypothetical protein